MKFNVTMEASDEEIRSLAADLARRGIMHIVGEMGESMGESLRRIFTPETTQSIFGALGPILQQVQKTTQQRRPMAGPSGGFGPPPGHPYGPPSGFPPGYPYGSPPPAGGRPNVVPLPTTGPVMEKCVALEETRMNEASWLCHQCACPNALNRDVCRTCGHRRCGSWPVVTPLSTGPDPNPPPPITPEPA